MTSRSMALAAISLVFALLVSPLQAAAQRPGRATLPSEIPVSGTFVDAAGPGTFVGTLTIDRFASLNRQLVALGTIQGTLTDAAGGTRSVTDRSVTLPVTSVAVSGSAQRQSEGPITTQQAAQDCQLVHLEFGGITLDVLGVQVALSPIVLDIGLGGLLGGILCGLLGALGGGAAAPAQANMLNQAFGLAP
jgi:hypothetical protein